jgi:hypothetical protein
MEAVMYLVFPELFGSRPLLLGFHLAVLLGYLALRVARHLAERSRPH